MIRELEPDQSYELLTTTTVGRIGFLHDGRVHIHPVNYALSGRDILLRTSAEGLLAAVTTVPAAVAFEVDYHDPLGATAWSVLMHGTLSRAPEEDAAGISARVHPWAGEDRDLALLLHIETMSGRSVQRDSRTPKV
ncbi:MULTISPECIES: pyridoxamine 5'-phosphate oxidase family protein [Microbacterium]|uniref:Pyridoxamine 5'-phosphate oxidase family protein n=1 Tax=Microbacterium sufflavum TaxID=2851649 RepID=A0ABY4IGK1_9MICO|nr:MULTISPECIES: pyridoxamine 5'-phosphate oxidase family protein [Microbacterium]MBN6191368.1 pyridoxamine 5'-phosphate oxidase family protein [Aneurinibacillus sp. BA2021]MCK2025792.1 pyridoxamine 5'-phosphate oxidase family protein [Microbacterium sufflavum]UPL10628.1 pyridoxamine 5'-phosphate oxidase family protein [Microbacterium sufflavum]